MKLRVQPEGLLEQAANLAGVLPRAAGLSFLGLCSSRVLATAVELDLFNRLADQPQTNDELAAQLKADRVGLEVLLECLLGMGLLSRRHEKFSLTRDARKWLTRGAQHPIDAWVRFSDDLSRHLANLSRAVRTGQVENIHQTAQPEGFWENYFRVLRDGAALSAPMLARWARLGGQQQKLLDIAGGQGWFSMEFCRRRRQLQVDILELPHAVAAGQAAIAAAGLADRMHYKIGDLFSGDWPGGYDSALMANVLHAFPADDCRELLRRARAALRPGGTFVLLDMFHPGARGRTNSMTSMLSLAYFATCGGRSWPVTDIRRWLDEAGLGNIRTKVLFGQVLLLTASAPA